MNGGGLTPQPFNALIRAGFERPESERSFGWRSLVAMSAQPFSGRENAVLKRVARERFRFLPHTAPARRWSES